MNSISSKNCSAKEKEAAISLPKQSTPQTFQPPLAKRRKLDRNEYYVIRGYLTICSISALVALFSILLMHSMSSIWLDPLRNKRLSQDFVYVTIALAASSASLNFYALATFGVQIYLVYSDHRQDERRMLLYLKHVATLRFIAAFSVFFSVPLFMASFGCYLYMEFRRIAALIAISILGFTICCIVVSVGISYHKWYRTIDEMIEEETDMRSKQNSDTSKEVQQIVKMLNPSFVIEENSYNNTSQTELIEAEHGVNILKQSKQCNTSGSNDKKAPVKPQPRKSSAPSGKRFDLDGEQMKEKTIKTSTKKKTSIKCSNDNTINFDLDEINGSASTLV